MNDKNILIVTEVNERVASGHLFECIICYEELRKEMNVHLLVNKDMPIKFKEKLPDDYIEYRSNIQTETVTLINYIVEYSISLILFNLREIKNDFIKEIRRNSDIGIICIDEFGHRALDADVIINPMISEKYWRYTSKAMLYCGAEYLVLPAKIVQYHKYDEPINNNIRLITVSMGGVDAPGTTLKMAQWLPHIMNDIHINLVLGGGFLYKKELERIVGDNSNITVYQNIDFLYDLFLKSDLAICAGGNTLHELAVMGVPTLVIPSMPHELDNGRTFQKMGFSVCCDMAEQITEQNFKKCMIGIEDFTVRMNMKRRGKKIADGNGADRVCRIIKDYIEKG